MCQNCKPEYTAAELAGIDGISTLIHSVKYMSHTGQPRECRLNIALVKAPATVPGAYQYNGLCVAITPMVIDGRGEWLPTVYLPLVDPESTGEANAAWLGGAQRELKTIMGDGCSLPPMAEADYLAVLEHYMVLATRAVNPLNKGQQAVLADRGCLCTKCYGKGVVASSGGATVNGKFTGSMGMCYSCRGKGYQTDADQWRNNTYWNHHAKCWTA